MRLAVLAAAVATAASMACRSGPSDAELTTALFEPVYRAAKAVQGATESGLVIGRYSELLQAFSTELAISRDKITLRAGEKELQGLFEQALADYRAAGTLWSYVASARMATGKRILLNHPDSNVPPEVSVIIGTYNVPIEKDPNPNYDEGFQRWLPETAVQHVWTRAAATLQKAIDAFYKRAPANG